MSMMNEPADSALPKGVRDFLPLKAAKIEYLQRSLRQVMDRWGFQPVIAPQIEFLAWLKKGLDNELPKRAFRLEDRQTGRMLAFPPDMTSQIARISATRMHDLPLPHRLCYSGKVLRHTEQQSGKDREIFQAGVELIGAESVAADAEIITMVVESLRQIGAGEFSIDIAQVDFFRGVLDALSLPEEMATKVTHAIRRKDSTELKALLDEAGVGAEVRAEVLALPRLFGGAEVLDRATRLVRNPRSRQALENLKQLHCLLQEHAVAAHVTYDLGELRGLGYHTGITFQAFLTGFGQAVCSGGRYDNLLAHYGRPAAATGYTFDLQSLLFALDNQLDARVPSRPDYLVHATAGAEKNARALASQLRTRGHRVACDLLQRSSEEARAYAKLMNYRQLLVVGSVEEPLQLTDLTTGESWTLRPDELPAERA